MIYILAGTDLKKRNASLKAIVSDREVISLSSADFSKEAMLAHATSASLFGGAPAIVIDTMLKEHKAAFSADVLAILKDCAAAFIFFEDKLLVADEKKYSKYATITHADSVKVAPPTPKVNTFAIVDAYAKRDKVAAWVLYCQAVEKGIEPEAISGILFWKIKTMIQNGTKTFTLEDLKKQSGALVSLYHRAHKGECDFTIGLEQFILSTLAR